MQNRAGVRVRKEATKLPLEKRQNEVGVFFLFCFQNVFGLPFFFGAKIRALGGRERGGAREKQR